MRLSLQWMAAGAVGFSILALPLAALVPSRYRAPVHAGAPRWVVPLPATPTQGAQREAAVWWAMAVQLAGEKQGAAEAALQAWDPAAPVNDRGARRQFLALDHAGYVERALAAAQKAERLAETPAERQRAQGRQREWEAAVGRRSPAVP
jgi:hypothetical protein